MLSMFDNAKTANGAATNSTTGSKVLDLFAIIGSARDVNLESMLLDSLQEDEDLTVRTLLWARDVRGGAGERHTFRKLAVLLAELDSALVARILVKVPEVGRFDDLLYFEGTSVENTAFEIIRQALADGNGLCAKWMPRQDRKGAKAIRNYMEMTPKQWRKMLVTLSEGVVEQKISANQWGDIEYGKVPSIAMSRYAKAFERHNSDGFYSYLEGLAKGTEKINASAIFPHDVIGRGGPTMDAMWKALPNYLEGVETTTLPVVDVSGSMGYLGSGDPIDIAIALGIYIAERSETKFKDMIISFSGRPNFHKIDGSTLRDKISQVKRSGEDMSTNLLGVFTRVLNQAGRFGWSQQDMPDSLLILSDMEFNEVTNNYYGQVTNFEAIEQTYANAGYKRPHLVFWNLDGRAGNNPVARNDINTTLVSGFSPAALKTALTGVSVSPYDAMVETLNNERYDF